MKYFLLPLLLIATLANSSDQFTVAIDASGTIKDDFFHICGTTNLPDGSSLDLLLHEPHTNQTRAEKATVEADKFCSGSISVTPILFGIYNLQISLSNKNDDAVKTLIANSMPSPILKVGLLSDRPTIDYNTQVIIGSKEQAQSNRLKHIEKYQSVIDELRKLQRLGREIHDGRFLPENLETAMQCRNEYAPSELRGQANRLREIARAIGKIDHKIRIDLFSASQAIFECVLCTQSIEIASACNEADKHIAAVKNRLPFKIKG